MGANAPYFIKLYHIIEMGYFSLYERTKKSKHYLIVGAIWRQVWCPSVKVEIVYVSECTVFCCLVHRPRALRLDKYDFLIKYTPILEGELLTEKLEYIEF